MSLFLIFSLPLALAIFLRKIYDNKLNLKENKYLYITATAIGVTSFCLMYLIHEFFLFEIMNINYDSIILISLTLLIQEGIFYYILPLLLFAFFFTFNPKSILKDNPIFFIFFIFGLVFSKNIEILLTSNEFYGFYEYIEIPIINIIQVLFSSLIIIYWDKNKHIKTLSPYKFIFLSILLLELLIATIKTLIILNLTFLALLPIITSIVLIIVILKKNV